MDCISCKICKGTGFVKRIKEEFCILNIDKLSSHLCYKCENRRFEINGQWKICKTCYGDGNLKKTSPKPTNLTC